MPPVPGPSHKQRIMPGVLYKHQPLRQEVKEIRLLEILPSKDYNADINCELRSASLDDDPNFDALSYLWGNATLDHKVFINGGLLGVTRNAHHALRDLRLDNESIVIWIDGICIDQTNLDERSHQVRLMRNVYSQATTVRIWLDLEFDVASPALQQMQDMHAHSCRFGACEEHGSHDLEFCEPALDVLREPYWERVWVQQELLLASQIIVHCRTSHFGGELLLYLQNQICSSYYGLFSGGKMMEITTTLRNRYPDYPMAHTLRGTIYDAREFLEESKSKGERAYEVILDLFYQAYPLQATNNKDKLYGLLGFLNPFPENLVTDYNLSTIQVYGQIFKMTISQGKCLEFLCYNPNTDRAFPSWFPNLERLGSSHWDFKSTMSACANISFTAEIDTTGTILRAKGFRADQIMFKTNQDLVQEPGGLWIQELAALSAKAHQRENREIGYIDKTIADILFWWNRFSYPDIPIISTSSTGDSILDIDEQKRIAWSKLSLALRNQPDLTLAQLVMGASIPEESPILDLIPGFQNIAVTLFLKSFIFTQTRGILGLAHENVQLEDEIWILFGCRLPVVLRPRNDGSGRYSFVGPAIIPDLAAGEACVGIQADGNPVPGYEGPPIQMIEIS